MPSTSALHSSKTDFMYLQWLACSVCVCVCVCAQMQCAPCITCGHCGHCATDAPHRRRNHTRTSSTRHLNMTSVHWPMLPPKPPCSPRSNSALRKDTLYYPFAWRAATHTKGWRLGVLNKKKAGANGSTRLNAGMAVGTYVLSLSESERR